MEPRAPHITNEPLVSVVTPVYNGATYLAECIESVLAQTYQNWEYVIANNCSTDETLEVAQKYATLDDRIRVHDGEDFLPIMPNWNRSMRQISPDSSYTKVVHADDLLMPRCLAEMVAVAEDHPEVGMVSAYALYGSKVSLDGLPDRRTVYPGRDIARAYMFHIAKLGGLWMFGSPSASLIRSDIVRSKPEFYHEDNFQADAEACVEILTEHDLGMVHDVLTYTREHDERQSTFAVDFHTTMIDELLILTRQGPGLLSDDEYRRCEESALGHYYKTLAHCVLQGKKKAFWDHHRKLLADMGRRFSLRRMALGAAAEAADVVLNPLDTARRFFRRVRPTARYEVGA